MTGIGSWTNLLKTKGKKAPESFIDDHFWTVRKTIAKFTAESIKEHVENDIHRNRVTQH